MDRRGTRAAKIFVLAGGCLLAAGLLAAGWLELRADEARLAREKDGRDRELARKADGLAEELRGELELLASRAQAIRGLRKLGTSAARTAIARTLGEGPGSILLWAEAESSGGARLRARGTVGNESVRDGIRSEARTVERILARVDPGSLDGSGIALLRLKRDSQRNNEWMALVAPDGVARLDGRRGVVLAIIDPAEAFAGIFGKASAQGDRAYLLGSDGLVLAHSQRAYLWSDFGRAVSRDSGISEYRAIDQLRVAGSFRGVRALPLGIGVELLISEPRLPSLDSRAILAGLALLVGLLSLAAALLLRLRAPRTVRLAESANDVALAMAGLEEARAERRDERQRLDARRHALERLAPRDDETLILKELPPRTEACREAPSRSGNPVGEAVDAQLVEQALAEELMTPPLDSRERLERQVAATRFEVAISSLREPAEILEMLAAHVAEVSGAQTLVFASSSNRAVLRAGAGFAEGTALEELAFPVQAALVEQVFRSFKQGRVLSLVDYPPLGRLLREKFGVARFRAWAIAENGTGRLLGAVAVLNAGTRVVHNTPVLVRAIRGVGTVVRMGMRPANQNVEAR
ncbi:MAG: hypothetical protein NDJ89_15125 [Oligoflexia bacterium]|nr:hypothetical protein [Oligoflexia bacterium]